MSNFRKVWSSIRPVLGWVFLLALMAGPVCAATGLNGYLTKETDSGRVIGFTDVDYVFSTSLKPPDLGWQRGPVPQIYRASVMRWKSGVDRALWGRLRFDRADLDQNPIAIYMVDSRCQLIVLVNGREVFRNYADPAIQKLSWYKPFLVPIPAAVLKAGINEISIRAGSDESVAIGRVAVGPHAVLEAHHQRKYFWRVTAPTFANYSMILLGALALLVWTIRRRETELLYLGLLTVFCFARNYQYFAEQVPFYEPLFNAVSVYSTYFGGVFGLAFFLKYANFPRFNAVIIGALATGVLLCALHLLFKLDDLIIYGPTASVGFIIAGLGLWHLFVRREKLNPLMTAVILLVPLTSLYDIWLFRNSPRWDQPDSFVVVYNGFAYCLGFLVAFGQRALQAFSDTDQAKQKLELGIAAVRQELAASERERQDLLVSRAIVSERERLMKEMHDGIGSNLIVALAIAEQQEQSPSTVSTLRRALADLKLTVDSMEAIDGDIVTLVGNLRHRMARDVRDAGLNCKWEAGDCKPLPWLDAVNALHVLRVLQEAISNVLIHAGATEIGIGCREAERDGIAGVEIFVVDNGQGFDESFMASRHPGKGLANMRSRASALHGAFEINSRPSNGTQLALWLPYERIAMRT